MSQDEENAADLRLHIHEAVDRLRYSLVKAEALLTNLPHDDECEMKTQGRQSFNRAAFPSGREIVA